MLKRNIVILSVLLSFLVNMVFSQEKVSQLEGEKWRADLQVLATEMPKIHPNLFHSIPREEFETAVKQLNQRIPNLARHQIIVEMMRIVAMIGEGDGHTSINPQFNPKMEFRYYPIKLYFFSDGLFIQAADKKYADIVGARVIKIDSATTEQSFNEVSKVVSHDNEMTLKERVPLFLTIPEVLHALNLIKDMEKVQFLVEKDGKQKLIELNPAGKLPQISHGMQSEKDQMKDWIKMNNQSNSPLALWLKANDENYRFEYLEESKTVYVQYNQVINKEDETIAAFSRRIFDFVNTHEVERFILDVRLNSGGNSFFNMPLLLGIIKSEKINRRGRFFTIIGRKTFSAAQNLVNELERYTNVIFVGEPTGAKVHFYGDHEIVYLPNSGITATVSTLWWQTMTPTDNRQWIIPGINAELSSEDYRTNKDPALNAIFNYQSITEILSKALTEGGIDLLVRKYKEFKGSPKTSPINTEKDVNNFGYSLLRNKNLNEAIEIFKLNTQSYPHSSNAYDSLGDAYSQSRNTELAIKSYEKSLELNPKSSFTMEKLKILKNQ